MTENLPKAAEQKKRGRPVKADAFISKVQVRVSTSTTV